MVLPDFSRQIEKLPPKRHFCATLILRTDLCFYKLYNELLFRDKITVVYYATTVYYSRSLETKLRTDVILINLLANKN